MQDLSWHVSASSVCWRQVSFRPADPEGPGWAILAFATPEIAKAVGRLNSIGSLCPGMSSRRESRVLETLVAGCLCAMLRLEVPVHAGAEAHHVQACDW